MSTEPTPERIVPAEGIDIDDAARKRLEKQAEDLSGRIEALRKEPDAPDLLPDVEIYYNAVARALAQNIFYEAEDVDAAGRLLEQGIERAGRLAEGASPWTSETGLVLRGYRSRLDDSVQPYGMVVPVSFDPASGRAHRLDIWHHGRNAKGSELRFLTERQTEPGPFTPEDTFVLHTYGRYCNAMKFAGEVDTFEALAHAKANYPVDDARLCVRGFSMGGAATWHQATHYAGEWVAATPGAGFAETAVYQNIESREEQPPWWERKLWALYDATKYAGNLRHCPTIAYSGENDKQRQAADIMAEHMAAEGLDLPHVIGAGMGHAYDDASKETIESWLAPIVEKGRDLAPAQVRFTTYTLRYDRMLWVRVDGLETHWERARVHADVVDGNRVTIETENVSGLTLDMRPGQCPMETGSIPMVTIDGADLQGTTVSADRSWTFQAWKTNETWVSDGPPDGPRKRHGLQGPIDDAFMDSFLMVSPTGDPKAAEAVTEWIERERAEARYQWHMQFRGAPRVRSDRDVTDADIGSHNLILWGDPGSNGILNRIAPDLPLEWDADTVRIGDDAYAADRHVPVMVYPNPLNPNRYIVLNSGFTFALNGSQSNATQTPKLPDWAILDIAVPPADRIPKGVAACDFFGERWEVVRR